jgi:hypothetical protein
MAKDKPKDNESKIQTPLEWLRDRLDHEYVRHQPEHKATKKGK